MLIIEMIFGSQLYGTDLPESGKDIKGIFLPSKEDIFLNRIPKSINISTKKSNDEKNSKDDIDTEIYSLHYFLKLACEGETVAIDMLHAPRNMWLKSSPIWEELYGMRSMFYTKNLKSFVGYARKQASKYGIKGSRLNDAQRVVDYFDEWISLEDSYKQTGGIKKLTDIWDDLPEGEHIFKLPANDNGIRMYQVCGRKVGETCTVSYAKDVVKVFLDAYGHRAKMASENQGIDWKAISHALRSAYQVREILTKGDITFPLEHRDYLRDVKQGKYDYSREVAPKLESLMDEVESLSVKSDLPESIDRKVVDKWLIKTIEKSFIIGDYNIFH